MPELKITLTRSPIGFNETQKRTVKALGLGTRQKGLGAWINQHVLWFERRVQHQPCQTAAATQRHVRLPGREGATANINHHGIERLALRLVNGHGPG